MGAHYGYTALALSRLVGEEGRVFAFEPVPETAGCLAATAEVPSTTESLCATKDLPLCASFRLMQCSKVRGLIWCDHSITSLAWMISDCGTVAPSAFAALRLITNSNLLACTTGRSAGFAPLRMRPI